MVWRSVSTGAMPDRPGHPDGGASPGGSLYVPLHLDAGETQTIRLRLAWYVPVTTLRTGEPKREETCCRGHQNFRTWLPIQPCDHNFRAASDGQLGGVMKVYRELHEKRRRRLESDLFDGEYFIQRVDGDWRAFLATATGYGTVGMRDGEPFLDVIRGEVPVDRIERANPRLPCNVL